MISCKRYHLAARCRQRGYTIEEVAACVVSEDGDALVVDETHAAYPRRRGLTSQGPGAELKALIGKFGIQSKPGCACNRRAAYMDKMGPDWCKQNLDQIVGWLREEHSRQKVAIPFVEAAVRMLVKYAIRKARKKANSQ